MQGSDLHISLYTALATQRHDTPWPAPHPSIHPAQHSSCKGDIAYLCYSHVAVLRCCFPCTQPAAALLWDHTQAPPTSPMLLHTGSPPLLSSRCSSLLCTIPLQTLPSQPVPFIHKSSQEIVFFFLLMRALLKKGDFRLWKMTVRG